MTRDETFSILPISNLENGGGDGMRTNTLVHRRSSVCRGQANWCESASSPYWLASSHKHTAMAKRVTCPRGVS